MINEIPRQVLTSHAFDLQFPLSLSSPSPGSSLPPFPVNQASLSEHLCAASRYTIPPGLWTCATRLLVLVLVFTGQKGIKEKTRRREREWERGMPLTPSVGCALSHSVLGSLMWW